MRNEKMRPWLPLANHGQGLQSLAVIFLFQAAALQQLEETDRVGVEPVFAIEEPEAHLHPQAVRAFWEHVQEFTGQTIFATHSPYFLQNVPLRNVRSVRLHDGQSNISFIPQTIVSKLPWNENLDNLVQKDKYKNFLKDVSTGCIASNSWFDSAAQRDLLRCYNNDKSSEERKKQICEFRHRCRILPSVDDEKKINIHGRRIRGEIFFARAWILVEGITEYLLLHALGEAFEWPLDRHGVSVINFREGDSAGIYATLAEAFRIPWHMIIDGDQGGINSRKEIVKRGFNKSDLENSVSSLPSSSKLEDQIVASCGHEILRDILFGIGVQSAHNLSDAEIKSQLINAKFRYMEALALRISEDKHLARQMPDPFVNLIVNLRSAMS